MHRIGIGAALLVAAISLVSQTGCVSPADVEEEAEAPAPVEPKAADLDTKVADLEAEVAALTDQVAAAQEDAAAAEEDAAAAEEEAAAAQAEAAAAEADAATAQAALSEAEAMASSAEEAASQARAVSERAQAETRQAQAEVAALLAAAPAPGIEVSPDQIDISLLDVDSAQVSLAGPDAIYVSSIRYAGLPYSALLRYQGGTSATIARVYGPSGALIPDSVDLSQTVLSLVAPDILDVANVGVHGRGYSGQLRYTGGNQLQVAGIQRVTLPPTAAQQIAGLQQQLAAAQAESARTMDALGAAEASAREAQDALAVAEAAAAAAHDEAAAARGEVAAARDEAAAARDEVAAAQSKVDMMLADAYQPSAVAVAADRLDGSLLSLAGARASLAGPDRVYVTAIEYAGESYSALLRYRGGTTATVEQVYGPSGKLIPDSVGLAQTRLAFVAPDVLDIAYVEVDGQGYSGQLRYAGDNRLEVAAIRRVTLPPTAAEMAAEAAAEAVAEAQSAADAAVAAAQDSAAAAMSDAEAAVAAAEAAAAAARDEAAAARDEVAAAQAKVDMMQADAYQPSAVAVSADRLDGSLLSLAGARASLAGPDRVYVTSIEYAGEDYSALLRYRGGTTATVEQVYGPSGKLIPDSVGLAQTRLAFVAPDVLDIAYVEVDGQGYSGQLRYAGDNRLEVAGIRRVTLPPTAAQQVSAAEAAAAEAVAAAQSAADAAVTEAQQSAATAEAATAAAEAATAAAEAATEAALAQAAAARGEAAAAQAKVDMMQADAYQPSAITVAAGQLVPGRLSFDAARASLAGPDTIYVSSIMYDGQSYSALLKYQGGTTATVEQVYGPRGKLIPDSVGLAQTQLAFAPPNALNISYVEVGGQGYAGQLRYSGGNRLEVTGIQRVTLPPTAAQQVAAAEAAAAVAVADAEATAATAVADAEATAAAAVADAEAMAAATIADAQATAAAAVADAEATAAATIADAEATAAAAIADAEATAAAAVADAEAAAAVAMSDAEAAASAARMAAADAAEARAELAVLMRDLEGRRVVPTAVDFNLVDLDSARVSVAGPDSIYVSGIRYDGGEFAARLRYTGASRGVVEALFDTSSGGLPELDLSAPEMAVLGAETMVISNVGIGGVAYSFTLRISGDGGIVISQQSQGHPVRTAAELLRDELLSSPGIARVVSGAGGGRALPDEGSWLASSAGVVSQTDVEASHAKFAIRNVRQPAVPTLYGVSVRTPGAQKLGYGLHFLASRTPQSGNTWNFGRSYLVWATREHDFYDTKATQVQLYESFDGNRLMWLNSRNLLQGLTPGLTLEALYHPDDCPEPMGGAPCYGSITVFVDGVEQFKVAVSENVAGQAADSIALRALGGPIEFADLYVHSR